MEEMYPSIRARNVLKREKIETLGELARKTEAEIISMRNVGSKTLWELKEVLAEYGLSFSTNAHQPQDN